MVSSRSLHIKVIAISTAAILCAVLVHRRLDQLVIDDQHRVSAEIVPSYRGVQLVSLGYERLLSDVFWLQLVQYCGATNLPGEAYQSTYDYVNLITELDPHFLQAYWFGCWAIGYWQHRPDLADKVLQRGIVENPNDWYTPYMAGVNQYIFAKNYKRAAEYYRKAAKIPDAPDFLERQALILESPVPEIVKQLHTLYQLYYSAKDGELKRSARGQLISLLMAMYKTAPTAEIRKTAGQRLVQLGFDPVTGEESE